MYTKRTRFLLVLVAVFYVYGLQGQQLSYPDIAKRVKAYYTNLETLNLSVDYSLLQGDTGSTVLESYSGSMTKGRDFSRIAVLDTEVLQFPGIQLTIDKEGKRVVVNALEAGSDRSKMPVDLIGLAKIYTVRELKESAGELLVDLELTHRQAPSPYKRILLVLDKSSYALKKQVLYLPQAPSSPQGGDSPGGPVRLVISYRSGGEPDKAYRLEDYLHRGSSLGIRAGHYFSDYQLINLSNI